MRIGQIAGHKDDFRLELVEQLLHDRDVRRPDRVLANVTGLVEGQVEKPRVRPREAHHLDAGHRLAFADDALDVLHLDDVDVARLLGVQEVVDLIGKCVDVPAPEPAILLQPPQEVDVPPNVVVEDRDVAAGHVSHQHLVVVLDKLAKDAPHGDDIIIRVRREADRPLAPGQLALAADLRAECIEDLAVHGAR